MWLTHVLQVPEEEALSHLVTLPDEGDSLDEDLDERRATTSMDDSTGTSTPFFYSFQVNQCSMLLGKGTASIPSGAVERDSPSLFP